MASAAIGGVLRPSRGGSRSRRPREGFPTSANRDIPPRSTLSPSLIVAGVALVAATGGTALAAGEIITDSHQIAWGAIQGRHLQSGTIPNVKLVDPQLKLRVRSNATVNGEGDGSVKRAPNEATGVYDVTFNSLLPGGSDTLITQDCAITATARGSLNPPFTTNDSLPVMFALRTVGPNTVRVAAVDPSVPGSRLVDTGFDTMAGC